MFERRNNELRAEKQEKLRVAAAGDVWCVLLKIMKCVWVAGALFKALLFPFHVAYSCMLL